MPTAAAATASPSEDASVEDDGAQGVTVEVPFGGATVKVTAHPVETVGDRALLRVDFEALDGELLTLALVLAGGEKIGGLGALGMRLVDPQALTVMPVLQDGSGGFLVNDSSDLSAGAVRTSLSVHSAPESDTVDVMVPLLGYVADVPVVPADDGATAAMTDLGTPAGPGVYPLRTYTRAADEATSVEAEAESITVKLRSDVLFGSSEYALAPQAATVVDEAAARIRAAADGGEVRVVGHTDDVDTDAFNQTLSEQRAAAVAERLRAALGDGYQLLPEGRGESEPVAAGTSTDTRAVNRRVEIVFTGTVPSTTEAAPSQFVPEATGKVVAADERVEVPRFDGDEERYSLGVRSVERRGRALVGVIEVGLVSGAGNMVSLFGEAGLLGALERGFGAVSSYVSLVDATGWTYPFDYEVPSGSGEEPRRRLLADEQVNDGARTPGATVLVSLVWPDTGADQVTIDIPGKVRFTDVPVTG